MADQGSGGAFEVSQRMTAMLGWGATSEFKEDWTWNQAAETYALDPEMAAKLRKSNPQASEVKSLTLETLSRKHLCLEFAFKHPCLERVEHSTASSLSTV